MQVSFTDVLRGYDARSKVSMIYVGVTKKEVMKCCLRFKVFKAKNTLCLIYLKVKRNI